MGNTQENKNYHLPVLRPDRTPMLRFAGKISSIIMNAALDATANRKKKSLFGKYIFPEKYNELKNCLVITPKGEKRSISPDIHPLTYSNNEIKEIYYAIKNINTIMKHYERLLLSTKNNYDIAIQYYTATIMIYQALGDMMSEFIVHCDSIYLPLLEKAKKENKSNIRSITVAMEKITVQSNLKLMEDNLKRRNDFAKELKHNINELHKQKKWVQEKKEEAYETMLVCTYTLNTVVDTRVPVIDTSALLIHIQLPPLLSISECNL